MRHFLHKLPFALNTLQTFVVAAETLSFKDTAERLHLSASAISRQIQALEQSLDVTLFIRHSRSLQLTDEGQQLFQVAQSSLQMLATAVAEISPKLPKTSLTLSALPYFSNNWLLPRLSEFSNRHPHIQLSFESDSTYQSFDVHKTDGCFRFAPEARDDLVALKLFRQYAVPVASPELIQQKGLGRALEFFNHVRWFDAASQPQLWYQWQQAHQSTHLAPTDRISFDDAETALQAAREGLGVAMAAWPLIEKDVKEERLVCLTEPLESLSEYYYFVYAKNNKDPSLQLMVEWLTSYQQLD